MQASIDRIREANQSLKEGSGPYLLSIFVIVVGIGLYMATDSPMGSLVVAGGAGLLAGKVIDSIRRRL